MIVIMSSSSKINHPALTPSRPPPPPLPAFPPPANRGDPSFQWDIGTCLYSSTPLEEDKPLQQLNKLGGELKTSPGAQRWTPKQAMEAAELTLSSKGYIHEDIEWRHVGLMPKFVGPSTSSSGRVGRGGGGLELDPKTPFLAVLIDLESVTRRRMPAAEAAAAAGLDFGSAHGGAGGDAAEGDDAGVAAEGDASDVDDAAGAGGDSRA